MSKYQEKKAKFGRIGAQRAQQFIARGENREWRSVQSGHGGPKVLQLITVRDRKKTAMEND